jgi:signal peptidase II
MRDILVLGVAALALAADQLTKTWVRQHLVPGVPHDPWPWLSTVFSVTYVTNTGVSFGLFPGLAGVHRLVSLAVSSAILLSYRRISENHWLLFTSLGLQLGGALGNLVDRFTVGQVTDFIDLNFWPLQDWPVFNIADSSVVVGVVLLAVYLLWLSPGASPSE